MCEKRVPGPFSIQQNPSVTCWVAIIKSAFYSLARILGVEKNEWERERERDIHTHSEQLIKFCAEYSRRNRCVAVFLTCNMHSNHQTKNQQLYTTQNTKHTWNKTKTHKNDRQHPAATSRCCRRPSPHVQQNRTPFRMQEKQLGIFPQFKHF